MLFSVSFLFLSDVLVRESHEIFPQSNHNCFWRSIECFFSKDCHGAALGKILDSIHLSHLLSFSFFVSFISITYLFYLWHEAQQIRIDRQLRGLF